MSPRNVWPAVTLASMAMLVVAGMAIAHVDKETIVLVTSVLVTPVLAALLVGQAAANAAGVQQLQAQTNGHQTHMLAMLERLSNLLAAAQPTTPPDTAPGDPTTPTS